MKKPLLTLLFLVVALSVWQVPGGQAQDTGWEAWLYAPETRHIWLVDEAGTELAAQTLPIPDSAYSILARNIGTSHNDRYIAYIVQHETNFDYRFLLYDREIRTMYSSIYVPPVSDFQQHSLDHVGGTRVFSPDDRYVAIGFQTSADSWEIHVIDIQADPSPRIAYTLSSSDPIVTAAGISPYGVPIIQQVTFDSVYFTNLNSMEGAATLDSYQWDLTSSTVFYNNRFGNLPTGLLEATDETLFPIQNTAYPNRLDTLEYPLQYNVVEAYYPPYGNFIYYNNPDVSVSQALFVQNGVRILVIEYEYDTDQRYWLLRERSGFRLHRTLPTYEYNSIAGMSTGFLTTATNITAEARGILLAFDTRDGLASSFSSVWNAPVGEFPRIMSVSNNAPVNPAEFATWGEHLDDSMAGRPLDVTLTATPLPGSDSGALPVITASDTPTPASDRPLAAGELSVGGRARVYTTEGDLLNMRSGPGTAFAVVAQLPLDTRVTVLEGPIEAGGFSWWRIRADDGTEGWAVDFVDDIPTLIPE